MADKMTEPAAEQNQKTVTHKKQNPAGEAGF